MLRSSNGLHDHETTASLLSAINRSSLAFFLLANVGTGSVNFSVQALFAPPAAAWAVLSAYVLGLCVVASVLHAADITVRL